MTIDDNDIVLKFENNRGSEHFMVFESKDKRIMVYLDEVGKVQELDVEKIENYNSGK